ncbi:hypothetical protein [Caulobacter sp. 17J65-9]|uniref:hypothetical protein n=1 Tax=Caulobacter sp. 17J65-9 TaxID=2709382 RepID=UPI0013C62173|nr:hypothetical protein [Caulobacter sp. 17J65-9]NEX94199.1 hypothetical protein [Caulobacter sp. 17J65-9]
MELNGVKLALAASAALALLAFAPGVAAAQDGRTVEGVQAFVSTQIGAGSVTSLRWGAANPTDFAEFNYLADEITPHAAKSAGRCATEFTDGSSDSVAIDWSRVSEVRLHSGGTLMIWGGVDGTDNAWFVIESPQVRDGLTAALQFLKDQC